MQKKKIEKSGNALFRLGLGVRGVRTYGQKNGEAEGKKNTQNKFLPLVLVFLVRRRARRGGDRWREEEIKRCG